MAIHPKWSGVRGKFGGDSSSSSGSVRYSGGGGSSSGGGGSSSQAEVKYFRSDGTPVYGAAGSKVSVPSGAIAAKGANVVSRGGVFAEKTEGGYRLHYGDKVYPVKDINWRPQEPRVVSRSFGSGDKVVTIGESGRVVERDRAGRVIGVFEADPSAVQDSFRQSRLVGLQAEKSAEKMFLDIIARQEAKSQRVSQVGVSIQPSVGVYKPDSNKRVTSIEEYKKVARVAEYSEAGSVRRGEINLERAYDWLEGVGKRRTEFKDIPVSFGIGVGKVGVGLGTLGYSIVTSPVKTAKLIGLGVVDVAKDPYKYGYKLGAYIEERPAEFAGQVVGLYVANKVIGKVANKAREVVSSKITRVKSVEFGDTEFARRADFKGLGIVEESGALGKVDVWKQIGKVKFGKKTYDVGVTSQKYLTIGEPKYSFKTTAVVSGKKGVEIFKGSGQGFIEMDEFARVINKQKVLGKPVVQEVRYMYKVSGEELGVLGKTGSFGRNLRPKSFGEQEVFVKRAFGGDFVEFRWPEYEILSYDKPVGQFWKGQFVLKDTRPVDPKFLEFKQFGFTGEAKTDYVIGTRNTLAKLKGATGEAQALTGYDVFGSAKEVVEFGKGKVKGLIYPEVVPKEKLFKVYDVAKDEWSFGTKEVLWPSKLSKMFVSKKAELLMDSGSLVVPEVGKVKLPSGVLAKPPPTLFEEGLEAARLTYLGESPKVGILPLIPIKAGSSDFSLFKSQPEIKPVSKPKIDEIFKPIIKPEYKPVSKPFSKPVSKPMSRGMLKPVQKPVEKLIQKPIEKTFQKLFQKPVLKTPPPPFLDVGWPEMPPPVIPLGIPHMRRDSVPAFDVLVKSFGKWAKVSSRPLSMLSALSRGAKVVSGTPSATFKILPRGMIPKPSVEDSFYLMNRFKFRTKKGLGGDVLRIEKNLFRIDTGGELKGITYKGLEALKGIRRRKKRGSPFRAFLGG